jgi:hypothetical protein
MFKFIITNNRINLRKNLIKSSRNGSENLANITHGLELQK